MDVLGAVSPLSVLSGCMVGVLVGLTGVGGGSLMTPLLILVFGTQATTAVGTDLLFAAATKSAGSIAHGLKQNIDWPIVGWLAAGSLPGAMLTVAGMYAIGIRGHTSPPLITVTLGIALLLSAGAMLGRQRIRQWVGRRAAAVPRWAAPLTVLAGLLLGVLVTISSVGAGALGMVMLVSLYPTKPLARLVGTDVAHAVPLTLVAGLGHTLIGSVRWTLLVSLLLGSVPGIVIGARLSTRVPERVLQPILAAVLAVVGVRMLTR
jgi:uncharacterized membrane protein YfcA